MNARPDMLNGFDICQFITHADLEGLTNDHE
jgi:hypothetical protein